ncbi:hypothetical protein Poly24_46000 [Rosistilla carotiformis]|uniref:Uncharacterized protein n=1 Tax=Rosistilla carotiformis TaxID=2528017 RepID=A0A518JZ88_9BACT|nr:hypothetical protein Poly24_46000 [Rosistilla carotiformis]
MTSRRKAPDAKYYYYIDIDLYSRQILSWQSDTQNNIDFGELTNGCYRVFLTKGQYNKLVKHLDTPRS